jgi:hypothetical protein
MTGSESGIDGGWGGDDGEHRQVFPMLIAMNFTSWSIWVQAIMEEQGWWKVVEPPEGSTSATTTEKAEQQKKDKKI